VVKSVVKSSKGLETYIQLKYKYTAAASVNQKHATTLLCIDSLRGIAINKMLYQQPRDILYPGTLKLHLMQDHVYCIFRLQQSHQVSLGHCPTMALPMLAISLFGIGRGG
jgi:hypothetical protein